MNPAFASCQYGNCTLAVTRKYFSSLSCRPQAVLVIRKVATRRSNEM